MAGYSFQHGMSNNAVTAYSRGRKPLSKITAADLKDAGWLGTVKLARALAKSGFWPTFEWHHSGGTWYNKVDFYDPSDLIESWQDLTMAEQEELIETAGKPAAESQSCRVTGFYRVFGGTRRRPTVIGEEQFTGQLIGNWIHLDDGGKKKADGNHIEWSKIQ